MIPEAGANAERVEGIAPLLKRRAESPVLLAGRGCGRPAYVGMARTGAAPPETVRWCVARALERFDPPPSSLLLGEWSALMGQDLFYPPNVGGWTGGRDWLTTQAIIGRANYAVALVEGGVSARPVPLYLLSWQRQTNVFCYQRAGISGTDGRCLG